ncbi:DUF4111 domain-containing protein [Erythrobacter sp. SCSIO 43205]|uniref:aminoglycoside adenylyltransferase domain-containing protein n=1 Tax=Erythrobacter sp. SCSIO 43205 TaxID=2779361 RepID=UPI001CA97CA0|nr:aminoglycoside adenylyltransferase domain-containing protein [Erythrobacter sp. SCSIO 43205]UAB78349.1 DUF4111 domain-containing protein [Erythrobacter sp. SCSIO 43205]
MQKLFDLLPPDSAITPYLEEVTSIHCEILGSDLVALYLHGSLVQNDFRPGLSDLDILGVVLGEITPTRQKRLTDQLGHEALPVPAFGLELIICSLGAVTSPVVQMPYEYALSTGSEWGVQTETKGMSSDILINMQLCRQSSFALYGPSAVEVLGHPDSDALRQALRDELDWHIRDLKDASPGSSTANAVLNAARSLYAATSGEIVSKSQGGEWWLAHEGENDVVSQALAYRSGKTSLAPYNQSAGTFAEKVMTKL